MAQEKKGRGRPKGWGNLSMSKVRPRYPLSIVAEIDRIREQFVDPEDAEQHILDCLTRKVRMQRLKLYDCRVAATPGITAFADSGDYEEREVPMSLLKRPDKSFLVKVAGDSMEDAEIHDGNFIIAEAVNPLFERPSNKAIVIAVVDDQMLVKRYRYWRNRHELLSENRRKNYPPIIISSDMSDQHSVYIMGIFRSVVSDSMIGLVRY